METLDGGEYFVSFRVAPERMDRLWAGGWRHFGWYFFRYRTAGHHGRRYHVIPLRIDLGRFALSRSQRRVIARNRDLVVAVRDAVVDAEVEAIFARHATRFEDDAPASILTFVSPQPATVPCRCVRVDVYDRGRLVGATFLDIGRTATSAVYAVYEPAEAKRSLGIFMMLESIRYSIERGCRFYYQGYAYREPFAYDYKKRFTGLEYLVWGDGWRDFDAEAGSPPGR